jgi:integrase
MIKLQRLTAMRPAELCGMRGCDIDRTQPVWIYRPEHHKTEHKNKSRIVPIGPQAQLLLRPFLPDFDGEYVWRTPSGRQITVDSYRRRIWRACDRAGIPRWSPNRVRHAAATDIRRQLGIEAAQVVLGHSSLKTSEIYAEKDLTAAIAVASKIG